MHECRDRLVRASLKNSGKIKEAIRPLKEALGINYFYYSHVTTDGLYTTISTNPEWNRYWLEEKLYLESYHHLQPQRYRPGTTVCLPSLEDDFRKVRQIAFEKYTIHYVIEVVTRNQLGIESYGFSIEKQEPAAITQFLTDLPCLKLFFKFFRAKNGELFRQLKDCQFNIGKEIGPSFFKIAETKSKPILGCDFLKNIGVSILEDLSRREREVCSQITKGLSAGEIAEDLELSRRTVESYIENIKIKLNCYTKAEMVQTSLDLEAIGYFSLI